MTWQHTKAAAFEASHFPLHVCCQHLLPACAAAQVGSIRLENRNVLEGGCKLAAHASMCCFRPAQDIPWDDAALAHSPPDAHTPSSLLCPNAAGALEDQPQFDAIHVGAAAEQLPQVLVDKLAPGEGMALGQILLRGWHMGEFDTVAALPTGT